MACNDRQLTEAQRQAGYDQQRTGVVRAIRPFSGPQTLENLIDYVNRELCPAVRTTRDKTNEVFKQVADNAPSANPLAYYFATATANADPTTGRMRLNQAVQNTATIVRVSQSNGRQQDVTPWLDVMSGGPTTPLGVLTMVDAINPSRFLRFDLNTMTDQGAYWDLGVTIVESSDTDPFVEGEPVVIGFIAGVSAAGSTIPVGALSPVARDTFLGNIGTVTAPPAAVPLANVDSTSIVYDGTAHEFQRAALTGFVASALNANANVLGTGAAGSSLSGDGTATMKYIGATSNVNSATTAGDLNVFDITALECGGVVTLQGLTEANIDGFTAKPDGFWFVLSVRDATTSDYVTLIENSGNTTTSIRTPGIRDWRLSKNDAVILIYSNTRWRTVGSVAKLWLATSDSPTWAAQQDNLTRTSRGTTSIRATLTGNQTLTGVVPDGVTPNGELLLISNIDTVDTLTIAHESASSTAANRFTLPSALNLSIAPRGAMLFRYDDTSARWRTMSGPFPDILAATANTFTNTNTFSSTVVHGASVTFAGTISPAAIGANQNDYNPTGWSTANVVRLSTSGGTTRDIQGASAGASGELKWLVNLGPDLIRLQHENAGSSAANRFLLTSGTTFGILLNGVCGIIYDGTSSRWRPIYPQLIT